MYDLIKVFVGAVSATFVFVVGQAILKLVLEPIAQQRRTIALISEDLVYFANVYMNPDVAKEDDKAEARKLIRRRASELRGWTDIIPLYEWWARCGIVYPSRDIDGACGNLRGVINASEHDHTGRDRHLEAVKRALRIRLS